MNANKLGSIYKKTSIIDFFSSISLGEILKYVNTFSFVNEFVDICVVLLSNNSSYLLQYLNYVGFLCGRCPKTTACCLIRFGSQRLLKRKTTPTSSKIPWLLMLYHIYNIDIKCILHTFVAINNKILPCEQQHVWIRTCIKLQFAWRQQMFSWSHSNAMEWRRKEEWKEERKQKHTKMEKKITKRLHRNVIFGVFISSQCVWMCACACVCATAFNVRLVSKFSTLNQTKKLKKPSISSETNIKIWINKDVHFNKCV